MSIPAAGLPSSPPDPAAICARQDAERAEAWSQSVAFVRDHVLPRINGALGASTSRVYDDLQQCTVIGTRGTVTVKVETQYQLYRGWLLLCVLRMVLSAEPYRGYKVRFLGYESRSLTVLELMSPDEMWQFLKRRPDRNVQVAISA